jgi:hypothetical protein
MALAPTPKHTATRPTVANVVHCARRTAALTQRAASAAGAAAALATARRRRLQMMSPSTTVRCAPRSSFPSSLPGGGLSATAPVSEEMAVVGERWCEGPWDQEEEGMQAGARPLVVYLLSARRNASWTPPDWTLPEWREDQRLSD